MQEDISATSIHDKLSSRGHLNTDIESRSRTESCATNHLRRMRRDDWFHELYTENHPFADPSWIIYVAHSDHEPIFALFHHRMIATTARTWPLLEAITYLSPYLACKVPVA
jgi:hypothetical protein